VDNTKAVAAGAAVQSPGQRQHYLGRCWDESPIEVEQPQKCLESSNRSWPRKFGDGGYPRGQVAVACSTDVMLKELNRILPKHALLLIDDEAALLQKRKNMAQMLAMS
jgi:hypothetical protein